MEQTLLFIQHYWDALLAMTAEMAPYLLLGFFIAGLLRTFVPRTLYSRHLAPRTMGSVVKAAAIGVPLPLCSCGVIPTAVSLRKEGASHGACASFLIATPQTGVDSIVATYSLMGLPFAIVRPIAALFTAIGGGYIINRYAREDEDRSAQAAADPATPDTCSCHEHGHGHEPDTCSCHEHRCGHDHCSCHHAASLAGSRFVDKLRGALAYGFVEMLQDVGKWLVVGLLIAALITVAVPNEWLSALHEYKLLNMLIVLAVAIPMYVCATGSIPIAVSLMAKGLTPGAALVLLMAGPAVNSASMLVIGKVFGRRTLTLYILSIVVGAMLFGLGIDYLLPQQWFAVTSAIASTTGCAHCLTATDWLWVALLALLLVNAFWQAHRPHRHAHEHCHCHDHGHGHDHAHDTHTDAAAQHPTATTRYHIAGMSCNHCRANVERAIRGVEGVTDVEVDLARAEAIVSGAHDSAALIARVGTYGYEASL
ncbi:MAG: SO_0444 family Cu/Zn efflux transporter [Bacteroidaceae bacterium]|nr:SO_0444 family Cu/Zn efflux transporter [Bacteroidaceae bacterium]